MNVLTFLLLMIALYTAAATAPPESFPVCVGVRGNAQNLWVHFGALARIVESLGPIDAMSGGSSGTITTLLTESIQSNPLIANLSDQEKVPRISFLLKSVEAFIDVDARDILEPFRSLSGLLLEIRQSGILDRLRSDDDGVAESAVEDFLDLLRDFEKRPGTLLSIVPSIINPSVFATIQNSTTPKAHILDIVENTGFSFNLTSPAALVRPALPNWQFLGSIVDLAASFYSGYEPVDLEEMEVLLSQCAAASLGKEWPEIKDIEFNVNDTVFYTTTTCGEYMETMLEAFLNLKIVPGNPYPRRVNELVGSEHLYSIAQSSGMSGDGVAVFQRAWDEYLNGDFNGTFLADNIDFSFVYFAYWGEPSLLERIGENIAKFSDLKSQKFRNLGDETWNYVLGRSPAEPGASAAVESGPDFLTTGGWADLVPGQILESAGCETVILIQRQGGAGSFQLQVASILGATDDEIAALFDLDEPNSGWNVALTTADASLCYEESSDSVRGLLSEGWNAPLVTTDEALRSMFPEELPEAELPGCTPLIDTSTNVPRGNPEESSEAQSMAVVSYWLLLAALLLHLAK